jgi:hypothetical protein
LLNYLTFLFVLILLQAAYQFGLKKKDGRDKKAFSEDKLKKQLRAVEDMIESKQGRKMSGFEDAAEEKQRKPRRHSEEDPYKTADVDNSSYEARCLYVQYLSRFFGSQCSVLDWRANGRSAKAKMSRARPQRSPDWTPRINIEFLSNTRHHLEVS